MSRLETDQFKLRPTYLAGVIVVSAVCVATLQRYDVAAMNRPVRPPAPDPEGFWDQINMGFQDFAQPVTIAVASILVATFDRKRRRRIVIAVLLAQFLALVTYDACKWSIGRQRPHAAMEHATGTDQLHVSETWLGWMPGNSNRDLQSFPSGHSAAAFALAGVLAWYYPRIRWMLWILATGCAATRVLNAAHWPSDCVAGGAIGYASSRLALNSVRRVAG